ncbi:MAG TPA: hypothetical protein VK966_02450, partial [Longimicrobiales bacterium]|nr:hypothetical protein [Longimicrobiales bacterium]
AALALAACDVPTEPPMWDQTWVLPGETVDVGVAELLPPGVDVTPDSSAFAVDLAGFEVAWTVAELCDVCVALDGTVSPKPAFTDTFTTSVDLPDDLISARLVGDAFDLRLSHQLSFDPLRPSSDPTADRGHIVVEVTSGGATVARDSISGHDVPFPADSVLTPDLTIVETDLTGDLDVAIVVYSPAGDPVTINTSEEISIQLVGDPIFVTQAVVAAGSITLPGSTSSLDLGEVDTTILDRIQSGGLRIGVEDPFGLAGELVLDFQTRAGVIRKVVELVPGETRVDVQFTGDELQQLLEDGEVEVTTSGSVAAPDGTLTVTPRQTLVLDFDFELVIRVGGSGGDA